MLKFFKYSFKYWMPYLVISFSHLLGTQVIVISKDWPSPVEFS